MKLKQHDGSYNRYELLKRQANTTDDKILKVINYNLWNETVFLNVESNTKVPLMSIIGNIRTILMTMYPWRFR